jgi:hypothetical protein
LTGYLEELGIVWLGYCLPRASGGTLKSSARVNIRTWERAGYLQTRGIIFARLSK